MRHLGPDFWLARDRGGDPGKGLAVWVEPIAFPAMRWGRRAAPAGLRQAGFEGKFVFWTWHSRLDGLLVLPVLMNRKRIEREAQRLAAFICGHRRAHPRAPIYLLGYSCGGFVALRALELLPDGVNVDAAALLQAAFDPRRDLAPAMSHVSGRLLVSASLMDWAISGLGTLALGGGDRIRTPAAGMLGALGPRGLAPLKHARLVHLRWRPRMLRRGLLGLHDWCLSVSVIARYVAPAMGIGPGHGDRA